MKRAKRLTRNEKIELTKQLIDKGYALSRAEAEARLKEIPPEERNRLKHVADTDT
jgi:hypothetical protein